MGAGSSTEQRSPEQPEAGSGAPAEPEPSGGSPGAEAAPGAPGDPDPAAAEPATKVRERRATCRGEAEWGDPSDGCRRELPGPASPSANSGGRTNPSFQGGGWVLFFAPGRDPSRWERGRGLAPSWRVSRRTTAPSAVIKTEPFSALFRREPPSPRRGAAGESVGDGNGPPGPRVLSPGPCLSQRRKASCWARARAAARPTGRPGVPGRPPPRFLAVPAATWVWYPVLLRQRRERAPPSRCGDSPGCSSLGAKENLGRRRVSRRNDRFQKNEAASSFSLRAFIACGLGWINTSRRRSG